MSTMTEREMLELAAKAAGYEVRKNYEVRDADDIFKGLQIRTDPRTKFSGVWNPIKNSDDALNLAVRLKLEILPEIMRKNGCDVRNHQGEWFTEQYKDHNEDAMSALFLAITRAAAEIGRSKHE